MRLESPDSPEVEQPWHDLQWQRPESGPFEIGQCGDPAVAVDQQVVGGRVTVDKARVRTTGIVELGEVEEAQNDGV